MDPHLQTFVYRTYWIQIFISSLHSAENQQFEYFCSPQIFPFTNTLLTQQIQLVNEKKRFLNICF